MATFDIVIAHWGSTDDLTAKCLACLRSIREHSTDYRLIFVDNASAQFDAIESELRQHPHLLVRNTTNLGFIKATNQGIWLSNAPYVVLLNNDTEVAPQWMEKLRAPLVGQVGISGPRTTTQFSWQGRYPAGEGHVILKTNAMLAFFATMFRREVFEQVGVLDEEFGVGLGDDDAYCHKAQRAGWRLALVQDLVIAHHHRSSFHTAYGPEQTKIMQQQALDLYYQKIRQAT